MRNKASRTDLIGKVLNQRRFNGNEENAKQTETNYFPELYILMLSRLIRLHDAYTHSAGAERW